MTYPGSFCDTYIFITKNVVHFMTWNLQLQIVMHLFLIMKVINILLNERTKIRTNGDVDEDHAQVLYHYAVIINQLFDHLVLILVHHF